MLCRSYAESKGSGETNTTLVRALFLDPDKAPVELVWVEQNPTCACAAPDRVHELVSKGSKTDNNARCRVGY